MPCCHHLSLSSLQKHSSSQYGIKCWPGPSGRASSILHHSSYAFILFKNLVFSLTRPPVSAVLAAFEDDVLTRVECPRRFPSDRCNIYHFHTAELSKLHNNDRYRITAQVAILLLSCSHQEVTSLDQSDYFRQTDWSH